MYSQIYNTLLRIISILANYPFNFERKNRFSVAILNLKDQTGSRFFKPIFYTNPVYHTWKYSIIILKLCKLVLKLLVKNRFSATILNFYDQTGSRILEPNFFTNHYHRSWKFAIRILKNISISSRVMGKKMVFGCHFEFLRPNRK